MPDELARVVAAGGSYGLLGQSRRQVTEARRIRARELVAGTEPARIADLIAVGCGCSKVRAYRLALGVALADVVAQIRARYEADGRHVPRFSETLLSAYESGQKRPGPEYLHYLCAAYGADPADLGFDGWCLCGESHRPAATGARPEGTGAEPAAGPRDAAGGAVADGTPPAVHPDGFEDGELRRMLIRQLAAADEPLDSGFLGAVDRIRRQTDEALLSRSVSAAMIDTWEQATAGYGRRYMTVPAPRLLCDVLLDLGEVRRMCARRQPLELAERLCRLACQLSGLAGVLMLDLGDHRLARLFFRTARTAADETGDRQLRAWVVAREALVPFYYGEPREAAALASNATDLAGKRVSAAAVLATVTEARSRARLASGHGRLEALRRARATLDWAADAIADLPADARDNTVFGYTERQLYFHLGDVLVSLGDWQQAGRAFTQAERLYPASERLDRALVALGRSRSLLAADEPGQALELARETVLALPPGHRADVIRQTARTLGLAVADRDSRLPGLAEYHEALAAT